MEEVKKLYKKYEEIINYIIVGVATTVVSLATYYACVYTILDPEKALELQIANVISWVFAVAFAFFANRKFVFKSKNPNIIEEATKFCGARVMTLLIDMGFMFLTVNVLHFNDKIMKLVAQVVVTILNYILSKLLVFIKGKE